MFDFFCHFANLSYFFLDSKREPFPFANDEIFVFHIKLTDYDSPRKIFVGNIDLSEQMMKRTNHILN